MCRGEFVCVVVSLCMSWLVCVCRGEFVCVVESLCVSW